MEYHFEDDQLTVKGESFSSQYTWEKVYKVTETKKWIFIWQSRQIANLIKKRDIADVQISILKEILDRNKVKNNLKD